MAFSQVAFIVTKEGHLVPGSPWSPEVLSVSLGAGGHEMKVMAAKEGQEKGQ